MCIKNINNNSQKHDKMYHILYVCMFVCRYIYGYVCFLSHCLGPGYWLLSRRGVPPPQSDHCRQLPSGESTHPIRHNKEHHIPQILNTYLHSYKHTYSYLFWKYTLLRVKILNFLYVCLYLYMYGCTFSLTLVWAWILAPFSASSATTSE